MGRAPYGTDMVRTIRISEEAFELLMRSKTKDESFSDTVVRLTKRGPGGLLSVLPAFTEFHGKTQLARVVSRNRRDFDRRRRIE